MSDAAAMLTAIAAFVAALGAIAIGWRSGRKADEAKAILPEIHREIVSTKDGIYELGKQLNGRLTLLLETTKKVARAEGRAEEAADEEERRGRE
jgi:hypothetical protein